jgi:hypothetical protein
MPQTSILKFLNPWKYRRLAEAERLAALRARDGDQCARCRRPMRFDLPAGHDQSAKAEPIVPGLKPVALGNFRLCHPRCYTSGLDHTDEVTERVRRKSEAALFAKGRKKKKAA